jgi:hypothetical protein
LADYLIPVLELMRIGDCGCGAGYNTSTGLGVVYDSSKGGGYSWQRSSVANGGITHFGVHLTSVPPANISYNWLDRNTDGKLYYAGTNNIAAGYPSPPPPPPPISSATVVTPDWSINASNQLVAAITNNTDHPIWVQGVSAPDNTLLTLDQLMATDPLFTSLTMAEAQRLDPGDTLSEIEDILTSTVGGRAIFWVYAFSGSEEITDARNGRNIYNANCGAACDFATMQGDLQRRMMTAANLGAPVPVPPALPLLGSGLGLAALLARRREQAQA